MSKKTADLPGPLAKTPKGASVFQASASDQDDELSEMLFRQLKKIDSYIPGSQDTLLGLAYKAGSRVAARKSYPVYLKLKKLVDSGVTVYSASKLLKIPYSTCYSYNKMTKLEIDRLKSMEKEKKKTINK
ncbi:MAG: hypothetical protein LBP92_05330 [Deltaproteobacteria bacterium]|nr:hypothetical protein [Deltaproteobacteria bacterium]